MLEAVSLTTAANLAPSWLMITSLVSTVLASSMLSPPLVVVKVFPAALPLTVIDCRDVTPEAVISEGDSTLKLIAVLCAEVFLIFPISVM
ncbi:MAG: hypothetical protein BWY32_03475 [bacterium ADurb.Bin243]|nr:MAG: hypothetical protein BWY32_03475 [bacterium ADurb.Bin243]